MAKKKFKHPVGRVRRVVREVLNMTAGYYLTEKALTDFSNEVLEPDASEMDVKLALEWNYAEGYVSNQDNEETEEKEWCITKAGIARENI